MKFARNEGKFTRYLFLFTLITIIGCFIGTDYLFSYLILVLMMLYGIKYIVKIKTSLYDMFIIISMLFIKILIETPFYVLYINDIQNIHFEVTMLASIFKILIVIIGRKFINKLFVKLKKLWDNNNFYIRYIFTICVYIYVIITIVLLIKMLWEV